MHGICPFRAGRSDFRSVDRRQSLLFDSGTARLLFNVYQYQQENIKRGFHYIRFTGFIVGNAIALSLDIPIGGCGCFGVLTEVMTMDYKGALVIDALLLVGVLAIFFQKRRFMALDSRLARLSRFNRWHFV